MARTSGGDKRSSWQTFQRRLFVVRRLVRGPASAEQLIADARQTFGDAEIYPPDATTALRHDLVKLRGEFSCEIRFEQDRQYHLVSPGRLAILDLPDAELEALAFLRLSYTEEGMPHAETLADLFARIAGLLPQERQIRLAQLAASPRLDRPQATTDAEERLIALLKRALGRQQVSFAYRASHTPHDTPIVHRVAPYDLFYRDGHTYLEAYCLACALPSLVQSYVIYRLDRMVGDSFAVLPDSLPPGKPPRRSYRLRYWLSPLIARRRDIALWFPESQVAFHDDGSAEVVAHVTDLWQARQYLLRYREHCLVHEPPELVAMMRESIAQMAARYTPEQTDAAA